MNRGRLRVGLLAALTFIGPAIADEVDVTNDAAVRDGEPSLAVNPTNSSELVMAYMKSFPGEDPSKDGGYSAEGGRCFASATSDGVNWTSQLLPVTDSFYSICADPSVIFTAGGVVYAAAIAFNPTFQVGHTMVTRSSDGGMTWSSAVEAAGGSSFAKAIEQGSTAAIDGFDRPWLAFDDQKHKLYLTTMTIFARPAVPSAHRYLVTADVSDNGELSWGNPSIVDSSDYPADHWATGTIAVAADGTVAIAYAASKVPELDTHCPCAVLATKKADGTFTHHTVPFTDPMLGVNLPEEGQPSVIGLVYGPVVAADPTQPGRYTVGAAVWKGLGLFTLGQFGIVPKNRVQIELLRTEDSGSSWAEPVVLDEDPLTPKDREHVWLAYSPAGVLGVIWRTHTGACCFGDTEVWSAVCRDGGTTYQKLSHVSSPFTKGLGDDYQSVALDGSFLHAAWADARSGDEDIYYERVPQ